MNESDSNPEARCHESHLVEQDDEPPSPRPFEGPSNHYGAYTPSPIANLTPTLSDAEQGRRWYTTSDGTILSYSDRVLEFRRLYYPDVSQRQWDDWHWQSAHRIRTLDGLERVLRLSRDERAAFTGITVLPFAITPYYLALLEPEDARHSLRRTVIPTVREQQWSPGESNDPLAEESHAVVPGLIHRYPDRVLFLAVDTCSTYCRYCTRSRVVGSNELTATRERWNRALDYIRQHSAIRDVLISGGDPLSLSDSKLDWLLGELRRIPHVEFLRIGTKMPAVLPQRITKSLVSVLRRHHPLWMSLHFVHPDECTPESRHACARLADAGVPLGSQSVLLHGVNDDVATLKRLMHRLLMMRVRPYYLYQCDPITGSSHFRTSVDEALSIIANMRGHTSGYAVPTYVIDAPGGGGKIPLQPQYVVGQDDQDLILRNFEGSTYHYPDTSLPALAPELGATPARPRRSRLRLRTVA